MKKKILLSLLSVLLLSAFSQHSVGSTEILTKINIYKISGDDNENLVECSSIEMFPWWPLYKYVRTEPYGSSLYNVFCEGFGFRTCSVPYIDFLPSFRGIALEVVESTCNNLIEESNEWVANGVYQGSISKKIAVAGSRTEYFLFQMNWNNDPKNLRNGTAEFSISKTINLGF